MNNNNLQNTINIHAGHRTRLIKQFMTFGVEALYDHQILELLLYEVFPRSNTNPLSHSLIRRFGSIENVIHADLSSLMSVYGVGKETAMFLKNVGEIYDKLQDNYISKCVNTYSRYINVCKKSVDGVNNKAVAIFINSNAKVCNVVRLETDPYTDWFLSYKEQLSILRSFPIFYTIVLSGVANTSVVFDYYIRYFKKLGLKEYDAVIIKFDTLYKVASNEENSPYAVQTDTLYEYNDQLFKLTFMHYSGELAEAKSDDHIYTL